VVSWELTGAISLISVVCLNTYIAFNLDDSHSIVKSILIFLSYFSFLFILNYARMVFDAAGSSLFSDMFSSILLIYGIIGCVLLLYFGWYLIYGNLKQIKAATKTMLRMK
jgi:hypothetical protein